MVANTFVFVCVFFWCDPQQLWLAVCKNVSPQREPWNEHECPILQKNYRNDGNDVLALHDDAFLLKMSQRWYFLSVIKKRKVNFLSFLTINGSEAKREFFILLFPEPLEKDDSKQDKNTTTNTKNWVARKKTQRTF